MKRILLLLTLLLCVTTSYADVTVGVGETHFRKQGNGIWWQEPYDNTFELNKPAVTLRYDTTFSGREWSVSYIYAGQPKTFALAKASDQAYAANTPYPLSHWYGKGDVQDLLLTTRFNYDRTYITAGGGFSYCRFQMTVPDWVGCTDYTGACLTPGTPKPIEVNHIAKFKPDWTVGVGYRLDDKWKTEINMLPANCEDKLAGDFPASWRYHAINFSILRTF